jgi:hypothetical protein
MGLGLEIKMAYVEWYTFSWPRFSSWAFSRYVGYFAQGVYVIWYWDYFGYPRTVRVGKGYIKNRLQHHHSDPDIQRYAYRNLIVSWTPILLEYDRRRVERYLGDTLNPMVGERFPGVFYLPVNLPWENV